MGRTTHSIGIALGMALLALSTIGGAAAQTPTATPTPDLELGEEIYVEKCEGCHGEDGTGIEMPDIPDLSDRDFWQTTGQDRLVESVMDGRGAMSGFEGDSIDRNGDVVHFGRDEIVDVLAHEANEFGAIDWSQVGSAADDGGPTATETETAEPSPTETDMPGPSAVLAVAGALVALYLVARD